MTSIMVAGFSFTMLPYGIICMMFYTSSIDCQGHTLPYTMITFLRWVFRIFDLPQTKVKSFLNQIKTSPKSDPNRTKTRPKSEEDWRTTLHYGPSIGGLFYAALKFTEDCEAGCFPWTIGIGSQGSSLSFLYSGYESLKQ